MQDKHSTAKRHPVPETDLSDLGWWIEVWYIVIQVENCQKEKKRLVFVVLLCCFVWLLIHTQVTPCLSFSKQRSLR